jgi:hypothetical protein
MSGPVARRICPLVLMKSDDRESLSDLRASGSCLTTGCFWSSVATVSLIAFQCACQTSNCDLCNCSVDMLADMLAGRAESLRLREYFGADFAGPHYRPDDPGELVGQRHRDEASRLFRSALIQSASAPLRLLTLRSSEVAERTSSFLM